MMLRSRLSSPDGNQMKRQGYDPARDLTLSTLQIGYILGLLVFTGAILVFAGCSPKQGADVDVGVKAKITPEPTVQAAPAPSTSRNSELPLPVTGK